MDTPPPSPSSIDSDNSHREYIMWRNRENMRRWKEESRRKMEGIEQRVREENERRLREIPRQINLPRFFISTPCSTDASSSLDKPEKEERKEKEKKRNNGWYLSIILGNNINLTMSSTDRFLFKKDYENFKLRVTLAIFCTLIYATISPSRPADAVCIFLTVWYYCTLTIRESILILNGSSIHWWWVAHHYLAAALAGVAVTWPEDEEYLEFRPQLGLFAMYICVVQQLQYQYQSGCLRRLHSLGSINDDVDVTLEGFASWMFHGLSFLLPFLFVAYMFELYNSFTLYVMWTERERCAWQVLGLSILFGTVGTGNIVMVLSIVWNKIRVSSLDRKKSLHSKYPSMLKMSSFLSSTHNSTGSKDE